MEKTPLFIPLKSLSSETTLTLFGRKSQPHLKELKASIAKDGLLNPLQVVKKNNRYEVVDGKKRLKAIKALSKSPLFTRALKKIPCIICDVDNLELLPSKKRRPALLSGPELAHAILGGIKQGQPLSFIAKRFDCDVELVRDVASFPQLNPKLLKCFNDGAINIEQTAAFATIQNPKAQWELLLQLGPFVTDSRIIEAIKSGDTVIELPDDNILIMPSRHPSPNTEFDKRAKATSEKIYSQPLAA